MISSPVPNPTPAQLITQPQLQVTTLRVGVYPLRDFTTSSNGSIAYAPWTTTLSRGTSLHLAAIEGNTDVLLLLLLSSDINGPPQSTFTPLFLALYHGHRRTAHLLLERGAHPYGPSTALHAASRHGYLDEITLFVEEYGLDSDLMDQHGATPVVYALRLPYTKAMRTIGHLLSLGADRHKLVVGWKYSQLARIMGNDRLADYLEDITDDTWSQVVDNDASSQTPDVPPADPVCRRARRIAADRKLSGGGGVCKRRQEKRNDHALRFALSQLQIGGFDLSPDGS
ncbi:Ankyrin repeat PH and SEC7 domain containing secG [Fusarium albosuccineum]|uniref:Ankyrin repeat PH and SEC7 domain containing secG n=1 Tax=Fusarium albosuccineum TaxID=1237068 RepID=A0A8H4LLR6_9HYPO|nr:Ankyrin repeat PH and SEC7 domain containing secG [Fusarium albosuccineum]